MLENSYFFEVDFEYPERLHDLHNNFPFAPEKKSPPNSKSPKLLCTLENKYNYVIHYRNLQLCIYNGLILKKIHRILAFTQDNFLKKYVDLNTEFRKNSKNEFKKSLFKLFVNSCFGKFIENQRNRINFRLISDSKKLERAISKTSFLRSVVFNQNLVGIHSRRRIIKLNKPIYVGAAILELSKFHMYHFYYHRLQKIFHDIPFPKLLYMDTDAWILSVQTPDIYKYIKSNMDYFDTSNYPKNHFCFSEHNKKIPGLFTDEFGSKTCTEFISLSPKVYCIKLLDNEYIKKIKGVKKNIVNQQITFENYFKCLFEGIVLKKKQKSFRSYKHVIYTIEQTKVALLNFSDKRVFFIDDPSKPSLALGHYFLKHDDNDVDDDDLNK